MAGITLRTARQVVPMIYAYTTPEIARHNGWTKIGYTEQSVDKRLKQQTHTADVLFHEEWRGNAVYDDGSGEVFTDHDFHAYLRKLNVENDRKNEWFHLDGQQSRRYFQDFRMNRGRVQLDAAIAYTLREEQEEHFAGQLFDPVVFDDSVKEFLNLKVKLADYFDESRTEDIFDYIPPQKTNQIFTPKWVVKKMVDLLEQENPGCFDDPGKTFLDPYMKSGLYITEIVKRLYRSEKMRQAFPDDNARLEHIFAKQVYGLAPTEIIYRIAISYILGFAKGHGITAHHIRQADTLEFAKAGTMERELDKIFRD